MTIGLRIARGDADSHATGATIAWSVEGNAPFKAVGGFAEWRDERIARIEAAADFEDGEVDDDDELRPNTLDDLQDTPGKLWNPCTGPREVFRADPPSGESV